MTRPPTRWMRMPLCLAALATAAGCGGAPGGPGLPTDSLGSYRVLQADGGGAAPDPDHGSRFLASMRLTPGQKARLAEIKADWPAAASPASRRDAARLEGLLRAETIDRAALETHLTLMLYRYNQLAGRKALLTEKARGVLTTFQRQKAAVAVLAHVDAPPVGASPPVARDLPPDKRAAFAWTKELTRARKMAALASFMLTGDQPALRAAWSVRDPDTKAARMAGAIASMTRAEREALIRDMQRAHARTDGAAPIAE